MGGRGERGGGAPRKEGGAAGSGGGHTPASGGPEFLRLLVDGTPDMITVLDNAMDIIAIIDGKGAIRYINQAVRQIMGYEPEELTGRPCFDFIHPDDLSRASEIIGISARDPSYFPLHEIRVMHKDGLWHHLEGIGRSLLEHPAVQGIVVSFRDITERKRMEKELRDRNEELEAFAHTISHDLLTPVAIVEGYAKAALEAGAEGRADAERECLEAIARGARRMNDLIGSLLQYAQAGHMDMETYRADTEEVLMEVLMDLDGEIKQKGVWVEVVSELPSIEADGVKLRQVFANLIGNAVRHMGDVPSPTIEVGAERESAMVKFRVRDNGIGIPAELQKKIYEPFRHFSLAESPGLGIGLATVRRAVTAWGGGTWVESTPGEGATFFFTAPLAE